MRSSLTLLSLSLLIPGCSSLGGQLADVFFVPNARSAKVSDETVKLEIAYSEFQRPMTEIKVGEGDGEKFTPSFVAGALAPVLAGAIVDQIGKSLATEAERYQATFSADAGGDQFYVKPFDTVEAAPSAANRATDIRFAGFKLLRTAKNHDANVPAMTACVIALPGSVDNFFYIIPVSYELNYAKAKVVAFDLTSPFGVDILNPWEIVTDPLFNGGYELPPGDDDIDIKMSVSLENMFFDKVGKLNVTNTAAEAFDLKAAKMRSGSQYFAAYQSFLDKLGPDRSQPYELSCDADASALQIAELRDRIFALRIDSAERILLTAAGRAFPSPKRAVATGDSNANFLVRVVVEETDEYGARIKELTTAFEKEKPTVQKGLTDFLNGEK